MTKKKYLIAVFLLVSLFTGVGLQAQPKDRLFAYPDPPADMVNLYERCNFLVTKFWEPCDMKSALSKRAALNGAFGDWLSFTPYASADTVYMAIDRLQEKIKKSADQQLAVIQMAEAWLYSDTAQYRSDELYSRFVDYAVASKKLPADVRRYYAEHKLRLDYGSEGKIVADIPLTLADGSKTSFSADSSAYTLLMIYRPDCFDCSFARVRLSADMVLNQLNDGGVVRIMSLYAGEPDAEFSAAATAFPEKWLNVASPEVEKYFDIRDYPAIYYLDKDHRIIGKDLKVENILKAFQTLLN